MPIEKSVKEPQSFQHHNPSMFGKELIFKNPQNEQTKRIKIGFNWPSVFFSFIALFMKGLIKHGLIVLGVFVVWIFFSVVMGLERLQNDVVFDKIVTLGGLGISIFLGKRANLWQARNLIAKGWIIKNTNIDEIKHVLASKGWVLNLSVLNSTNLTSANASVVESATSSVDSIKNQVTSKNSTMESQNNASQWYFSEDNECKGPISQQEVQNMLLNSKLNANSMVWRTGLSEWVKLGDTELKNFIDADFPPPLPGKNK